MNLKKGFTLVELLIVVAIIGILSTVVFATISGTRPRARDAQRLAEVKEAMLVITVLETSTSGGGTQLCAVGDVILSSCTGGAPELAGFIDPSGTTACTPNSSDVCDYAISTKTGSNGAVKSNDYQICFYIEDAVAAGLTGGNGVYNVSSDTGGRIVDSCD